MKITVMSDDGSCFAKVTEASGEDEWRAAARLIHLLEASEKKDKKLRRKLLAFASCLEHWMTCEELASRHDKIGAMEK